jgi:gentisate 1,2-dioxygenase
MTVITDLVKTNPGKAASKYTYAYKALKHEVTESTKVIKTQTVLITDLEG